VAVHRLAFSSSNLIWDVVQLATILSVSPKRSCIQHLINRDMKDDLSFINIILQCLVQVFHLCWVKFYLGLWYHVRSIQPNLLLPQLFSRNLCCCTTTGVCICWTDLNADLKCAAKPCQDCEHRAWNEWQFTMGSWLYQWDTASPTNTIDRDTYRRRQICVL